MSQSGFTGWNTLTDDGRGSVRRCRGGPKWCHLTDVSKFGSADWTKCDTARFKTYSPEQGGDPREERNVS